MIFLKICFLAIITLCISCNAIKHRSDESCSCEIYIKTFDYILYPVEKFPLHEVFSENKKSKIIIDSADIIQYKKAIPESNLNAWNNFPHFEEWKKELIDRNIYLEEFKNLNNTSIYSCAKYFMKSKKKIRSRVMFYKYNEKFNSYSEYIDFIRCCDYNSIEFSNILFDNNQHAFLSAFWRQNNGGKVFFKFLFKKENNEWKLKHFFATPA